MLKTSLHEFRKLSEIPTLSALGHLYENLYLKFSWELGQWPGALGQLPLSFTCSGLVVWIGMKRAEEPDDLLFR